MKGAAQTKMEADAKDNEAKGKAYRDTFAKEKGVKTSSTVQVYKVEKKVPVMRLKTATPLWLTTKVL